MNTNEEQTSNYDHFDLGVIGGGLAGLTAAIILSRAGWKVLLLEQKDYPRHKVCGEYISNEVRPLLQALELFPDELEPAEITSFQMTSENHGSAETKLELGGFGISRYALDNFLYYKAVEAGVVVTTNTKVSGALFNGEYHDIETTRNKKFGCRVLIGAHGKRSVLDKSLNRRFILSPSAYVGVKQHFRADFPRDLVSLNNFSGGYAGLSGVEDGKVNLCYLTTTNVLEKYENLGDLHRNHLTRNPWLKDFLDGAEPVFEKPLVISQVSFRAKLPVEDHILFCGDSAGLIHPLCGNGMAMAIHAAALASDNIHEFLSGRTSRQEMESAYQQEWQSMFSWRLRFGKAASSVFGRSRISGLGVQLAKNLPGVFQRVVKLSHGSYIDTKLVSYA